MDQASWLSGALCVIGIALLNCAGIALWNHHADVATASTVLGFAALIASLALVSQN